MTVELLVHNNINVTKGETFKSGHSVNPIQLSYIFTKFYNTKVPFYFAIANNLCSSAKKDIVCARTRLRYL